MLSTPTIANRNTRRLAHFCAESAITVSDLLPRGGRFCTFSRPTAPCGAHTRNMHRRFRFQHQSLPLRPAPSPQGARRPGTLSRCAPDASIRSRPRHRPRRTLQLLSRIAMRSADGTNLQAFHGEDSNESLSCGVICRGERHRMVVSVGEHLRSSDMAFGGLSHGQRVRGIRVHAFQSPVREHLVDDVRHGSHRTPRQLLGVSGPSKRTASGLQHPSRSAQFE